MQETAALEKAAVLAEAIEDFVALSQEANDKINDSIEDDPELGLVLSPPPKRKSGGSIPGQVSKQGHCHEPLLICCPYVEQWHCSPLTAIPLLCRWASSWRTAVAMSPLPVLAEGLGRDSQGNTDGERAQSCCTQGQQGHQGQVN